MNMLLKHQTPMVDFLSWRLFIV